jgi:hypothetical protein
VRAPRRLNPFLIGDPALFRDVHSVGSCLDQTGIGRPGITDLGWNMTGMNKFTAGHAIERIGAIHGGTGPDR